MTNEEKLADLEKRLTAVEIALCDTHGCCEECGQFQHRDQCLGLLLLGSTWVCTVCLLEFLPRLRFAGPLVDYNDAVDEVARFAFRNGFHISERAGNRWYQKMVERVPDVDLAVTVLAGSDGARTGFEP